MKLKSLIALLGFVFIFSACGETNVDKADLDTQKERASYAIGLDMGKNMKRQYFDIDTKILFQGIIDGYQGNEQLLSEDELAQTVKIFEQEVTALMQQKKQEEGAEQKTLGEAFLAENKTKEGVITLDSGLQYKILKPGTGRTPNQNEEVTVHYVGTLVDGTKFDSSYDRGEPTSFGVTQVISGWGQALVKMKKGAKWQLWIPPGLAYGEYGAGDVIPPNATLIFEVELLDIQSAK